MEDKKSIFIIKLGLPDIITLFTLLLSLFSILLILNKIFFLAIFFLFLCMLSDTFDGMLARKLKAESDLGRYLDSFVDVIAYLIAPSLFLFFYGFSDIISTAVLFVFICAGILRLSKFNIIGVLKEDKKMEYKGLPVFWSHFLLVVLVSISRIMPGIVFRITTYILLFVFSFLMIFNKNFIKPKGALLMALFVLGIIIMCVFLYLHFRYGY